MKNLIGMTDFVLIQVQSTSFVERVFITKELLSIEKIRNYANFLKQPLELGMFVPCVDNEVFNYSKHGNKEQYKQAKERCLFDGFEFIGENYKSIFARVRWDLNREMLVAYFDTMNIEDLIKYNLQLTETAIKQIGF